MPKKQRENNGQFAKGNDLSPGAPSKIDGWLPAFEIVVYESMNSVIFSDDELRILTNNLVEEKQQISEQTFHNWKKGKISNDDLRDGFLYHYKKALFHQKKLLFEKLENDDKAWQRYAWIIERKFDDWNLRSKQEVTGKDGTPIFTGLDLKLE